MPQAHAAALEGLAAGTLTDAAKKALADAGEAVDGDVKVETVTEGKVWKATGNFGGVDRELTIKQIGPRISFFKSLGVYDKTECRCDLGVQHDGTRNGRQPAQHVLLQRHQLRRPAVRQHQQRSWTNRTSTCRLPMLPVSSA